MMKKLVVIFLVLISSKSVGQVARYYTLDELATAPIDSVFYIDLSREKLEVLPSEIYKFIHLKG